MIYLKTYEHFRNIFKKDHRKSLVEAISNLAKNVLKNCEINIRIDSKKEKSIFIKEKDSRISEIWCSINFEKELGINGSSDFCIWFSEYMNYVLNEFIISVMEEYSDVVKFKMSNMNIIAYNIQNKDIPEIVKQLTLENYEQFESTKKYNL